MASVIPFLQQAPQPEDLPVLHLSGPKLRGSLERLIAASEAVGGVERLAEAVKLKAALFQQTLGAGGAEGLTLSAFEQLCAFMPTCRRRIAPPLQEHGFHHFRDAIAALLDGAEETGSADDRVADFVGRFPKDREHRFVRDLAAEILHYSRPEQYPLMTRWVWDERANTGVLREIWHGDNVDHMVIDVPDGYATFLSLRMELAQFLSDNGVFRDILFYVNLLQGQIYAEYINAQGGAFLRTDFSSAEDPLVHLRRILGLDGIDARTGRSRFKTIDGEARVIGDAKLLPH